MHAYRAIVDKRDQRAFLPRPLPDDVLRRILHVLGFGYIDPDRAAPPRSVARRRLPIEELMHWEGWRT